METYSALLALCVGNSPVTGEFSSQRPVTQSFDVFSDMRLDKRSSKQWRRRWFETPSRSLCRHCNVKLCNHPHICYRHEHWSLAKGDNRWFILLLGIYMINTQQKWGGPMCHEKVGIVTTHGQALGIHILTSSILEVVDNSLLDASDWPTSFLWRSNARCNTTESKFGHLSNVFICFKIWHHFIIWNYPANRPLVGTLRSLDHKSLYVFYDTVNWMVEITPTAFVFVQMKRRHKSSFVSFITYSSSPLPTEPLNSLCGWHRAVLVLLPMKPTKPWALFQYRGLLSGYGIPMLKIRRSRDRLVSYTRQALGVWHRFIAAAQWGSFLVTSQWSRDVTIIHES